MRRTLVIIFIFNILLLSCQYGTGVGEKKYTPKEYLNNTQINRDKYINDRIKIRNKIQKFIANHDQSFYSKEYFDSTELEVDTILYNEDHNKVIVFVLAKNPTYRQIVPNKKYSWYYDAYCYLGIRKDDTFDLKWMHPFSLINFYDKTEASEYIKDQYFTEFSTLKDTSGAYSNKYNLDDRRFWESPIWEEIEQEKIRKKKFEEEKRNHPENIYEPKH